MSELAERFCKAIDLERLERFARGLGLSVDVLTRLGIGWCAESSAWSFPMSDAQNRVIGVRLRTETGRKFAVRGGRDGLFVPTGLTGAIPLLLAEGPTDTAALLELGFDAVGRPNNNGGKPAMVALVRRLRPNEVVVVADNDSPGRDGALGLVERLAIHVPRLRIISPPPLIKDVRAWKQAGAGREEIQAVIGNAEVHRVSIRTKEVRH
jgi:hypothetical protein